MKDQGVPSGDKKSPAKQSAADSYSGDPMQLLRRIEGRGPAPVHLWDPPYCGDMDLTIARDGSWIHEGSVIRRAAMVNLFASVLKREADKFYLVTPVEKIGIKVEDCPFVVTTMEVEEEAGSQRLLFTTNTGETVVAGPEHSITVELNAQSGEPHPIIHIRSGLNALINRAVFYRLVDLAEHRESGSGSNAQTITGVNSGGVFFELGRQKTNG